MRVALLTPSISRLGGGIPDCVRNIGQSFLENGGVEPHVFSVVDEFSEVDKPAWRRLPLRVCPWAGFSSFRYAPSLQHDLDNAKPDIVHTHGLWTYLSVAASVWSRRTHRPSLITPHGMLDPWAVRNARWKKRIAARVFEWRHLKNSACLHALCQSEADSIRAYGLQNPICIIPNGVELPLDQDNKTQSNGTDPDRKTLLFLGRLHPKKGLLNLLQAWAICAAQNPTLATTWRLRIAGWDQSGHIEELRALVADLRLEASVDFAGPLYGGEKAAAFLQASAFILPSFSEGLPLSVLEAWSYRLPVLMTLECNIPEGFAVGAALRTDPEPRSLSATLQTLFRMTDSDRSDMGEKGRLLVERSFTWPQIARQMHEVYRWLIDNGPQPPSIQRIE